MTGTASSPTSPTDDVAVGRRLVADAAKRAAAGDVDGALQELSRAIELARGLIVPAPGQTPVEVSRLWADATLLVGRTLRKRGDLPQARLHLEEALRTYQQIAPGGREVSSAMGSLGLVLQKLGEIDAAVGYFKQALALDEALGSAGGGDSSDIGADLNNLALGLVAQGQPGPALELLERALQIPGVTNPSYVAVTLDNLGMARRAAGDLPGAVDALGRSVLVWSQIQPGGEDLVVALRALDAVLRQIGDARLAVSTFEGLAGDLVGRGDLAGAAAARGKAIGIRMETEPQSPSTAIAIDNTADLFRRSGAYPKALQLRREALAIFEQIDPRSEDVAICLTNIASQELVTGELADARDNLMLARAILERVAPRSVSMGHAISTIGQLFEADGDVELALMWYLRAEDLLTELHADGGLALVHNNIAGALLKQQQYAEAADEIRLAIKDYEGSAPRGDDHISAVCNLGAVLLETGDLPGARASLEQADELSGGRPLGPLVRGGLLLGFGVLNWREGHPADALPYLREARTLLEISLPGSSKLHACLNALGQVCLATGDLAAAIEAFEAAVPIGEGLRNDAGRGSSRDRFFGGILAPYEGLVTCFARRGQEGDVARAFDYAERSRARGLADRLAAIRTRPAAQTPEQVKLLAEERELMDRIADLRNTVIEGLKRPEHVLKAAATSDDFQAALNAWVQQIADRPLLEQQLETVQAQISAAFVADVDVTVAIPVTLSEIRGDLPADTLWLYYAFAGKDGYVWAIRRDAVELVLLPDAATRCVESLWSMLEPYRSSSGGRSSLGPPATTSLDSPEEEAARLALSTRLLGPIPPVLWQGVRTLRVSPDGLLHLLPFELLTLPDGDPALDRFDCVYAPSATVFETLRRSWKPPAQYKGSFVGFGDPRPVPDAASLPLLAGDPSGPLTANRIYDLDRLRATGPEVVEIAKGFGKGARTYLGPRATEWHVRGGVNGYRIVHFATHGVVQDDDADFGGLVMSPPQRGDPVATEHLDDFLQVPEIAALPLSAELVVCSACQTGLGALTKGEGIVGMAYALFRAGARSVVVSLWSVPDTATAALMTAFYGHLRAGASVATALRDAKLYVRSEPAWSNPYFWAAFVALGPADVPPGAP